MPKTVKDIMQDDMLAEYDFSGLPALVRRCDASPVPEEDPQRIALWKREQAAFMKWTQDSTIFSEEYVRSGREQFDRLCGELGHPQGNVLDIGGGWGLFRQWWEATPESLYIVHDPGVERFLAGPGAVHHRYYERGFALPSTFVEGFGETLPYRDGSFDSCLIASTLDHCLDPARVLSGAFRCLAPGGELVVIQQCEAPAGQKARDFTGRLIRFLTNPKRLIKKLYSMINYHGDSHLSHFQLSGLVHLLEVAGFDRDLVRSEPIGDGVYWVSARRKA